MGVYSSYSHFSCMNSLKPQITDINTQGGTSLLKANILGALNGNGQRRVRVLTQLSWREGSPCSPPAAAGAPKPSPRRSCPPPLSPQLQSRIQPGQARTGRSRAKPSLTAHPFPPWRTTGAMHAGKRDQPNSCFGPVASFSGNNKF